MNLFDEAARLVREERDEVLRAAESRAQRLRYVKMLRIAFPEEREPVTQEEARVAACREAGVPPWGPL